MSIFDGLGQAFAPAFDPVKSPITPTFTLRQEGKPKQDKPPVTNQPGSPIRGRRLGKGPGESVF